MILPLEHVAGLPARIHQGLLALETAFTAANRSALAVAARLAEAERGRWAEALGFEDVAALAATLFGCPRWKTRELLAIHQRYVETLRCPTDVLAAVPWTKLAALRPVVSAETVAAWLARARVVALRVLRAEVRQLRRGEPPIARVSKSFALPAEAEPLLELALDRIGRQAGTDDRGRQLELLAADALAGPDHAPAPGRRPWVILLTAAERQRLTAALVRTGRTTPAEALMALATHGLCCAAPSHAWLAAGAEGAPGPWTIPVEAATEEPACAG